MLRSTATILLILFSFQLLEASDSWGNLDYDGLTRRYLVHLPPHDTSENLLPVVLNIHGYGNNPARQARITRMSEKADEKGFMVVYPEGTDSFPSWNAGTCCGWADSNSIDDVGFISALIDTILANYPVDPQRIYITGMSNGGMMAHLLACELSDKVAAFAAVAGGLVADDWSDCRPERPVPIMHIHSRNDNLIPYYGGENFGTYFPPIDSVIAFWAELNQCNTVPDSFSNSDGIKMVRWKNIDENVEVVLWTSENGGHVWPRDDELPGKFIANDLIWQFFSRHRLEDVDDSESGIEELPESPDCIIYSQNYPNPFSQSTEIKFSLSTESMVKLDLYDVQGRKICNLALRRFKSGNHQVLMDASNLPAGIYFYRLETEEVSITNSLLIVK